MIVSETSNRSNSRWLQACVLLCAVVVLPLGVAHAQDCDAVERRLGAAVSDGELSLKQAVVMMNALRSVAGDNRGHEDGVKSVGKRLENAGERIKAAAAKGDITEKEAWAKWHEVKERTIKGAFEAGRISREEAGALWREIEKAEIGERLKAAVAKGEITEKEALAKWAAIDKGGDRKRGDERKRITPEDLERAGMEIRKAVAAGKITPEQGRARMQGMRKMMGGHGEHSGKAGEAKSDRPDWGAIKRRIEGAVKAGKMTREEANKQYESIKKRMAYQHKTDAKKPSREEIAEVGKKIKAAVKAGKVTEAQGKARWEAYLKSIGAAKARTDDLEAIWKRLQAMVKAGKLTEKEAHKKMAAIKKEAAAKAKAR